MWCCIVLISLDEMKVKMGKNELILPLDKTWIDIKKKFKTHANGQIKENGGSTILSLLIHSWD